MSLKSTLHRPRQLNAFDEASEIFRQSCDLPPPPLWIDLLIEGEPDAPLTDEAESHVSSLAFILSTMNDPDAEWIIAVLLQNHPELEARINGRRSELVNSIMLWGKESAVEALLAKKREAALQPTPSLDLPSKDQRKVMDREEWLSFMEPVRLEREFRQAKELAGPAYALAKLTKPFVDSQGSILRDCTTATSNLLEDMSRYSEPEKEHRYRDGDYRELSPLARGIAKLIFSMLYGRLPPEREPVDPDLKWALQHFALMAFEGQEQPVNEAVRKRLRGLATADLAAFRGRVRAMDTLGFKQANLEWGTENPVFDQNIRVVLSMGGLSDGLSQLVQILRVLPFPAVGSNLTFWGVEAKELGGWSLIPSYLIGMIHRHAERQSEHDLNLRMAREGLAEFCLKRIGQRKGQRTSGKMAATETLVEPNAYWRACYLYAVDSLRVNPQGKGHETVYWAKSHDPDPMVREIATEVYPRIKRHREIPDGSSPRRPLVTAIWWLLQAHRSALGLYVNEESIQATLSAFVRRTTATKKSTTQTN